MKQWILILAFALSPALALAGKGFQVNIDGMTCGSCVKMVEKEVARITKDVQGLKISVKVNKATVDTSGVTDLSDAEKAQLRQRVEKAVVEAGYEIVSES